MNGQHRGNQVYFDFTQRQQLSHIYAAGFFKWYEYTYDKNGNMSKRQDKFQGQDSTNFQYDTLNRVTLCEQTGANDVSFARSHYDYDVLNNVQDTWREEQGNKGERYGYDFANQLKSVLYNANNVTTTTPSGYDRNVSYNNTPLNRASVNDNGAVTSYTSNGLNQYTAVTGQTPAYDPNFNLTRYNGWTYVYDADGRLTSASATGHSAQFVYDGLGRCVKRTIDGITMTIAHDGWKPIVEWDGTGNLVAWNLYGAGADEILMRYQVNIGFLHYHLDRQGNVAFLLNASNTGIEKYTYDAFGRPKITDWNGNVRTTSAYANRFMFTGREYLTALGIYDYRNRFYHPALGRFLQSDPIGFAGGDNNLFRYCAGDPVNRSDPSGLQDVPFEPSQGQINGYVAQYYQGQYAGSLNSTQIGSYNASVPIYNGGLSLLSSASFRFGFGVAEIGTGVLSVNFGLALGITPAAPAGGLEVGVGGIEIYSGMHNVGEAADGHGFELGPRLETIAPGQDLHLNYLSYSNAAANQQFAIAIGYAIGGAVDALFNAAQTYGSGYGHVTVTSSAGSQVVFGRRFDSSGYYGPAGPGNLSGAALGAYLQTKLGVPGGGGLPGEGSHPVPFELN